MIRLWFLILVSSSVQFLISISIATTVFNFWVVGFLLDHLLCRHHLCCFRRGNRFWRDSMAQLFLSLLFFTFFFPFFFFCFCLLFSSKLTDLLYWILVSWKRYWFYLFVVLNKWKQWIHHVGGMTWFEYEICLLLNIDFLLLDFLLVIVWMLMNLVWIWRSGGKKMKEGRKKLGDGGTL